MNEFFIPPYSHDTISSYAKRLCNMSSVIDYTVVAPDQVITGKFNNQSFTVWPSSTPESIEEEFKTSVLSDTFNRPDAWMNNF